MKLGAPVRSGPLWRKEWMSGIRSFSITIGRRACGTSSHSGEHDSTAAQATPQRLQTGTGNSAEGHHSVTQPRQPAQVMPQTLQQQRDFPQRNNHSSRKRSTAGNQRYTPPNQNQSCRKPGPTHGNATGATVPRTEAPNSDAARSPEQHYTPAPNVVQGKRRAADAH